MNLVLGSCLKWLSILAISTMLSACNNQQPSLISSKKPESPEQCKMYGFIPGSPQYIGCVEGKKSGRVTTEIESICYRKGFQWGSKKFLSCVDKGNLAVAQDNEKRRKQLEEAQIKPYRDKCHSMGVKQGHSQMATCILMLQKNESEQKFRDRLLEEQVAQRKILEKQIQEQKRRESSQAINDAAIRIHNNRPLYCSSYSVGTTTNTTCR